MTSQEIETYLTRRFGYNSVKYVGEIKNCQYYAVTMHPDEVPTMYHILTPRCGESIVRELTTAEKQALRI